jgi:excisionase family DNA binding protein
VSTQLPQKPFFSPRELSAYLDIPYATLAAWRCRGEGGPPWYRFGRHVRYRHEDVLAWIERNRA